MTELKKTIRGFDLRGDLAVVDTLLWLVQIPSLYGEEGPLCDAVSARLGSRELAGPIRRYGHSIVVPVTRGTGGPKIALVGHLDVVRTEHEGEPRIEGDKLFGPGAADMKSGLAVMIDLVERSLADFGKHLDLTLVFYAREEGPFADNELGRVLTEDPELKSVDLAVCMEPSDNKLSLGASGSIHAIVRFHGKTAHSARPWQGENALHKAGAFLSQLGELVPRESTIDGLVYRSVFSATMGHGGRGRNVVPDLFEINLNHRFAPDRSLAQAEADILELVAGRAEVVWHDRSPAALPFASHPLVVALKGSGVAAVEPKQAWTDVARFAAAGIAAVNFGPGDNAQAHQKNEFTSVSKVLAGREIVHRWLTGLG